MEVDMPPWDALCADCTGPHVTNCKGQKPLTLHCVTMMDPAAGLFKMTTVYLAQADLVINAAELMWLNWYPWPDKCTLDRGNEFLAEFHDVISNDYNRKLSRITTRIHKLTLW